MANRVGIRVLSAIACICTAYPRVADAQSANHEPTQGGGSSSSSGGTKIKTPTSGPIHALDTVSVHCSGGKTAHVYHKKLSNGEEHTLVICK